MRHAPKFIAEVGGWALTSALASLVFFAFSLYEHFTNQSASAYWLLVAFCVLFALGALLAWNRIRGEKNALEEHWQSVKPELEMSIREEFTYIGKKIFHFFLNVRVTLKEPASCQIEGFAMSISRPHRGPETLTEVNDLNDWEWRDNTYTRCSDLLAIPRELKLRGELVNGWVHFMAEDIEPSLHGYGFTLIAKSRQGASQLQIPNDFNMLKAVDSGKVLPKKLFMPQQ